MGSNDKRSSGGDGASDDSGSSVHKNTNGTDNGDDHSSDDRHFLLKRQLN